MSWIANFLKPHRTIPITPWTGNGRWDLSIKRVAILLFGLTIFGFGDALIINSLTGNAPWTVLSQGIASRTSLNIGEATFLVSAAVLFFWWPLGERLLQAGDAPAFLVDGDQHRPRSRPRDRPQHQAAALLHRQGRGALRRPRPMDADARGQRQVRHGRRDVQLPRRREGC